MKALYRIGLALLLFGCTISQAAESNQDDLIKAFLRENFDHKKCGMVIGLVDEHGSRVFAGGKLDNGTNTEVTADSVFEIGSITKTFTVLLLQDMVARGQMNLDDPVAKYLPESVKAPIHDGREITLSNLAAQDSGLPHDPNNISSRLSSSENPLRKLHRPGRLFLPFELRAPASAGSSVPLLEHRHGFIGARDYSGGQSRLRIFGCELRLQAARDG